MTSNTLCSTETYTWKSIFVSDFFEKICTTLRIFESRSSFRSNSAAHLIVLAYFICHHTVLVFSQQVSISDHVKGRSGNHFLVCSSIITYRNNDLFVEPLNNSLRNFFIFTLAFNNMYFLQRIMRTTLGTNLVVFISQPAIPRRDSVWKIFLGAQNVFLFFFVKKKILFCGPPGTEPREFLKYSRLSSILS